MIRKSQPHQRFEDVYGPGPVGGTQKLDAEGPNGPGTVPTRRAIEKSTGDIIIVDDATFDPELHEELPRGGGR